MFPLPENLNFEAARLFCLGVTAYRAVRRAGIGIGQRAAVLGVVASVISLQLAKLAEADVTAVDTTGDKLDLALDLGAENAVLAGDLDKLAKFDVLMVHTPSQRAVDQDAKSVKPGGTSLMAVYDR